VHSCGKYDFDLVVVYAAVADFSQQYLKDFRHWAVTGCILDNNGNFAITTRFDQLGKGSASRRLAQRYRQALRPILS